MPPMDLRMATHVGKSWRIEIEPEVRHWLELLPNARYDRVERAADMFAARPTTLGEPYSPAEHTAEHTYDRTEEERL